MTTLNEILSSLGHLTQDELVTLNNAVCNEFKVAQSRKTATAKASLSVGDTVSWTSSRTGAPMSGELIKINRKNAKVQTGITIWTVPMTMLKVVA